MTCISKGGCGVRKAPDLKGISIQLPLSHKPQPYPVFGGEIRQGLASNQPIVAQDMYVPLLLHHPLFAGMLN